VYHAGALLFILVGVARMSKVVLVVDDDPAFLSDLSQVLTSAGYSVITARNGREAILALDRDQANIGAAIIDLALPEIGGFQIIGELTKVQKRPIPLVAITGAYSDIYLEVAGYLGAHVALRKPDPGQSLAPIVDALNGLMDAEPAFGHDKGTS
jgi:CheY-like chemotaxis protein